MVTIDIGMTKFVTRNPAHPPRVGAIFNVADPTHVYIRRTATLEGPPCVTLSDSTYLYITRGNPFDGSGQRYCPTT
ncbi:MAG TPA: hypothetical protein VFG31_10130 [Conexibacter sp.]|nr:hypothetical protein [Conexibacter sp.]